jgi:aminoglycoside 6'-N-acetyltransferase I
MMEYREITADDIDEIADMYVETFNAPPWNDKWTKETAGKRLSQIVHSEGFYGICAYQSSILCGMILGCKEQFFDGVMFNIKEFCVRSNMRGQGLGTEILEEFEARLKRQGIKEIVLFTSRNDQTEGLYRKRELVPYESMVIMGRQL